MRVPATTANLGPGFDCLGTLGFLLSEKRRETNNGCAAGMAVDLWNELTVSRASKFEVVIQGEGAQELPVDATNLVVVGVEAAFKV